MNQLALYYYSVALDILRVSYFLALRTMPDPQICDMRQILALPLASDRLSKL